jgi:serine/threonine-protein kinase
VQPTIGSRLGSHDIVGRLGAGGMGEVFLAHDTKLKRRVAIKVLPAAAAHDADRLARFHREAEAVAALNHPNIAAIYDLEESAGITYLVLELVEGDTLADRLRQAPLSIDDSLTIARQILEALEVAHEKGICHRDLKPANIKLTADGVVKVLDFGIAKFLDRPGDADEGTTLNRTSPGVVIGTPGYMSPEQAKGLDADERSDIFSFGCIFYELLTGCRAFDGDTTSEAMASILKSEVDFLRLPPALHPRLREILARCLEKNPRQRWHAAADVRMQIEAAADREPAPLTGRSRGSWQRTVAVSAAAVIVALTTGYAAWTLKPVPSRAVTRFLLTLPEGQQFSHVGRPVLAVSRDGMNLVYVANRRLYLRPMAGFESSVIPGSELPDGVQSPAFSPDGQWLVFRSVGDTMLKRLPITGGVPVAICPNAAPFGLSWSERGILFGEFGKGILRCAPEGGAPEVVVPTAADEMADSPQLLPGARAVLFSVKKLTDDWDQGQIAVQPLDGGPRKTVVTGGSAAIYVDTGHLVYAVGTALFAVPFDLGKLTVTGGAISIVEGVNRGFQTSTPKSPATAQYAVSSTGSLVFAPGTRGTALEGPLDLAIFDRASEPQRLGLPPAPYGAPRASRDGKWAAVERTSGSEIDIWIVDLGGSAPIRRLTFGGRSRAPVWTADSQWLVFQSEQAGVGGMFRQRVDGTGTAERLTTADTGAVHIPQSASADDAHLLFTVLKDGEHSLHHLSLSDRRVAGFGGVRSPTIVEAAFSPNGRWVAYSGGPVLTGPRSQTVTESFVQPFPATGVKYQIPSVTGAARPVWTPAGDGIVFGIGIGRDAVIPVVTAPRFELGKLEAFSLGARLGSGPASRRNFDPIPDGRILGLISLASGQSGGVPAPQIAVVLNWFEELRARVR